MDCVNVIFASSFVSIQSTFVSTLSSLFSNPSSLVSTRSNLTSIASNRSSTSSNRTSIAPIRLVNRGHMTNIRYQTDRTVKALEFLGFNVRAPDGGHTIFCTHGITKAELWIPKTFDGVCEDVLIKLFKPINLCIGYFQSVYNHISNVNLYPNDQH